MEAKTKMPAGGLASSKNAQDKILNGNKHTITQIKPPKKSEVVVATFLQHSDLNTFQANKYYGDTCLHSAVSTLEKKHGIKFKHSPESVINRIGKKVRVMRYHLLDTEKAQRLYIYLRRERGISQEVA